MMTMVAALLLLSQAQAKLPVPEASVQKKNEKSIRDLLRDSYQKKDQNSRRTLAKTLLEAAEKEKDPVLAYSFIREAADVAGDAMDFDLAMAALDRLETLYKVEPESPLTGASFSIHHDLKKALLKRVQKSVQGVADASSYVKAAVRLADLSYAEDGFDDALAVAQMAEGVAQASGDRGLQSLARAAARKYGGMKKEHDKIAKSHLKILSDPNDPEAAAAWGLFLMVVKDDWGRGVEWAAKGKDSLVHDAAKKEFSKAPDLEIAEGWIAAAEKGRPEEKSAFRGHAREALGRAAQAASGIDRLKVEKKLEDLERAMGIVDLLKIVDPAKDFSAKGPGKGGFAKIEGSMLVLAGADFLNSMIEFPYQPPQEYVLTLTARHAGGEGRPLCVGLSQGDHQWVVTVGANYAPGPGILDVDGKFQEYDEEAKKAQSLPSRTTATYTITVRTSGFTLAVNGKDIFEWAGDPKRLTVSEMAVSKKTTLFLCAPSSRWEVERAVVVPTAGPGQKLR